MQKRAVKIATVVVENSIKWTEIAYKIIVVIIEFWRTEFYLEHKCQGQGIQAIVVSYGGVRMPEEGTVRTVTLP